MRNRRYVLLSVLAQRTSPSVPVMYIRPMREGVRRERGVGLPGVPRALHAQPVHRRDQVDEVRAGQVRRAADQPGTRRDRQVSARLGQPHHHVVRRARIRAEFSRHPVPDSRLVEGGQQRVTGRCEHDRRGPQRLPGRPAEQSGRHPRAGREDDQQAGAVAIGDAEVVGPAGRVTGLGADTTWIWL